MKECLVSALSNFVFLMAVYTVCANLLCPHIRYICFCKIWLRVIVQSKSVLNFISVTDDGYSRSLNPCAWAYLPYNQQPRMSRRPLTVFEASAKCPADVQLMTVSRSAVRPSPLSPSISPAPHLTARSNAPRSPQRLHYPQTRRTRKLCSRARNSSPYDR